MDNGTIGCDNPDHRVNERPPPGLSFDEAVDWMVRHAPPLTSSDSAA
jgi:hypothetical protein